MQLYYSELREKSTLTLHNVRASTQKEGTYIAEVTLEGRKRYLQIDTVVDREVLAQLDCPCEIVVKNFGSIEEPALLIWKDGARIDQHGSGRAVAAIAPNGATAGSAGAASNALCGLAAAAGMRPVSLARMGQVYQMAWREAQVIAAKEDPTGEKGFSVADCTAAIGGWYMLARLLGAPVEK